ncbi:MAG: pilin protein [Selenomonadaceae bacterium]|nr:pilin protein [Selenomonadaceae bacterium]
MKKIRELFKKYKEEKGQGVVEYALVLGFVAVIAVYLIGRGDLQNTVVKKGVDNATAAADVLTAAYASASHTGT